MQLNKIQDPRDSLSKARRIQISRYAEQNGITDIKPTMPAELMRQILRQKGIQDIGVRAAPLGGQPVESGNDNQSTGAEVNALADLAKQWEEQQALDVEETRDPTPVKEEKKPKVYNKRNDLRAQCKTRGIKVARTDTAEDMRRKLDGENAA